MSYVPAVSLQCGGTEQLDFAKSTGNNKISIRCTHGTAVQHFGQAACFNT